ncbi:hypothetical protein COU54_05010 [Candidatus Pacearchaeota archaeon CG10_big_fil_rev_8_21_14_0_10_31_24]|nr:MAG: hypothetical protein COU54_05010 [Candidatus Pacearchaeota archaeon CG10_big_fil_rev_8_21_14_0_10_31_24]
MTLKRIEEELKKQDFRVTIFGSARIRENDQKYKQIHDLGKQIGNKGWDIVTGGGPGLMKAANTGHKSAKPDGKRGHSIGLGIKLPHEQDANTGVEFFKEFRLFTDRLDDFMLLSNAIVVTSGGIGTVLELFYTWQLMQVKHACHIPVILLGEMWPPLIKWVENHPLKNKYLGKEDMHLLFLAKDNKEVMKVLDKAHNHFIEGKKDFCTNYKQYKIK